MTGKLYGIGLGPGASDLVTVRGARLIQNCDVVAYPALEDGKSFAREIAADYLGSQTEIRIEIPMTVERVPAQTAYDIAAKKIATALSQGKNVAVLCEGDPLFYGSFMYLHARLSKSFQVEVVPGVSSIMACAAVASRPLVARNERLIVLPGPLEAEELKTNIIAQDTIAIMKVGRHIAKLKAVISDLGLTKKAIYIERASLGHQKVIPLAQAPSNAPYFSMILITKGADPWL